MSPPRQGSRGPGRPSAHRLGRGSSGTWGGSGGLAGCCLVSLGFLAMAASGVLILMDPSSPPVLGPFSGASQSEAPGRDAAGTPTATNSVTAPSDSDRGAASGVNVGTGRGSGGSMLASATGAQVLPRRSLQGRIVEAEATGAGGRRRRSTLAQDEMREAGGTLTGRGGLGLLGREILKRRYGGGIGAEMGGRGGGGMDNARVSPGGVQRALGGDLKGPGEVGIKRNARGGWGDSTSAAPLVEFEAETAEEGPGRLESAATAVQALPVAHRMDDEELLWRASFISLRDPERRAGARKVAFLFSFTDRLVFAPLWARFLGGHQGRFSVYLHGTKATVEDKGSLPPVFQDRFVPVESHQANGDPFPHMYAVDAVRRLVANALLDMGNEWFVIVCELCIPLHSFDYFYDYFSSNPTRNFVPHQTPPVKNGQDRFMSACFEPLVSPEQWRKGGPWLGLSRRMGLQLVADVKFYDKFASCCQPVKRGSIEPCFPLEHYLATVLPTIGTAASSYAPQAEEVTNWSVVFEDWWTESWTGRPFVYNASYVSEKLIRTMRRCHLGNLCHLQGAHFHPSTLPMLLNMTDLLGY